MDIDASSVRDTTGHPKSHSNVEKWTPPRRGVAKWPCETVRLWPLISRRVDCDGRVTGRVRVLFHVACPCASTSSYSSNWCLVPNSANAVMARWSCNKVSSNTINFSTLYCDVRPPRSPSLVISRRFFWRCPQFQPPWHF